MRDRGLEEFGLVDITSFSKDGTQRKVHGYRAVRHEIPPGYMPEPSVQAVVAGSRYARLYPPPTLSGTVDGGTPDSGGR